MQEHPEWRVEKFSNELDPFANIQWYVMQGNVMIAQCEIESYAETIVLQRRRQIAYEEVLQRISSMTSESHDLEAAIEAAFRALQREA